MSAAAIVKTLAKEFSVDIEHAQHVFDLVNAGFKVPTIARFRRAEVGLVSDGTLRRFARRMRQFEELDKRRETLLRSIAEKKKSSGDADAALDRLRNCMDRAELEDLFLPHRRPEPEVQLALDRGLGALADVLVEPGPKPAVVAQSEATPETEEDNKPHESSDGASSEELDVATPESAAAPEVDESTAAPEAKDEPAAPEASEASESPESKTETDPEQPTPDAESPTGEATPTGTPAPASDAEEPPVEKPANQGKESNKKPPAQPPIHGLHIDLTLELARACKPFVIPDRGVHTDQDALEGAVRILADRLGRNPSLRVALRRAMRKHGRISVRGLVSEKELGHNRSLLKLKTTLRQLQGHRLLALRQAQVHRHIAVAISIDESLILPKVRAALGKRIRTEFVGIADAVAEQALRQRLLPIIEDEIRNELRERADEEAIRFLSQHLRQTLLAPPAGPRQVAGVHVDAKGDWLIVLVDGDGTPAGEPLKIEVADLALPKLAEALGATLRDSRCRMLVMGNGKSFRDAILKLREALEFLKADASLFLVNDAGLSSYANSEPARRELPDHTVPARQAIGLARRLQDPLAEFLKGEIRHLGLGREQTIISKATLRRVLHDAVESCVAHVGCDLNSAPLSFLRHVPGLNFELAKKLVARRSERAFSSREELRTEGLLDDLTWTNAIGFLRVADSSEPLDRTALHPEHYDLVRKVILDGGGSVEETLGRRDASRGLRRNSFDVDEHTWRDLTREISHPGRDPRPRVFEPRLLPVDTDVKTLEKGQVVEGIVSNVTSFGAFVDLGVRRDGMIHISEISSRYVRDARTLLSIGQVIRARVLDSSGPRVELSLKNVPDPSRSPVGRGRTGAGARGGSGRGARDKKEAWPEFQPTVRAARTRRDGLGNAAPEKGRRGGGGGRGGGAGAGGRGGGRPGGGRGGGRRGARDEHYDSQAVKEASKSAGAYNPFANFFDKKESGDEPEEASE